MTVEDPLAVEEAPSADGPRASDGVWAPHRRRLSLGLVLTITLVAFESLAISTVMPVVADDLGGLGLYGWVFSGFFLGSLFGIVSAGQAADRRGTAVPFAVGLVLFSAGLLVGGLAPSMGVLVAARVAQGVGAGAIPAVAYTSVGRSYPPRLRPRVFAVFSSAWVIPGLIGPATSSALADALSWRAVFLALLPLVVLAAWITIPVLTRTVPAAADDEAGGPAIGGPARPTDPDSDQRGVAVVLIAGVAAVLVAANGPPPAVAAALILVGVPVAVRAFLRLVPAGTLRLAPGIPAAVFVRGILTFAFFGTDAFVSLTFQDVRDQPTWVAGTALTAATVMWTAGAWTQDRLIHTWGPRRLVMIGFAFLAVGIAGMLGAQGLLLVPVAIAVWAWAGFGVGLAYSPLSVTVLGLAEPGRQGSAAASIQLTDVLGTALGTGATGAFVAVSEAQGWLTSSALRLAFSVTFTVALAGIAAARRLPTTLPT
ncbi:MAG: MFS transporter [Acidimicrobiales bacterium]